MRAKQKGMLVSFDVNYRTRLWAPEQARVILSSLLRSGVDILICTKDDAATLFGLMGDAETSARQLQATFRIPHVVITHGDRAVVALPQGGFTAVGFALTEVDRLGAGDAFVAGFLYDVLQGNWETHATGTPNCAKATATFNSAPPMWISKTGVVSKR